MNTLNKTLACALVLLLGACSSATNLTGAKTQKAGEHETYIGGSYSGSLVRNNESSTDSTTVPGFDVAVRYGVTDLDEVGAGLRNAGQYSFDYKRSLMKDAKMALSVGAGLGYLGVTVGTTKTTYMDFSFPVYFDYSLGDDMTLLLSAKYLLARVSGDAVTSASNNNLGFSGGIRFGEDSGFHLEYGLLKSLADGGGTAWQASAGFFF